HWPTKPALAVTVAEVIVELEPGSALGVLFEQPAKPATTISAAAAAIMNPGLTILVLLLS
ncbi:MAG TPA: hypothetical protein VN959_20440, partial [Mycobacterium sp.]|nr:hypothetical protein [Mycobacterium sp.]